MGIKNVGTGKVTTSCVLFCLIALQVSVLVSGNAGEDFLNEKEAQVGMIVNQAIINYNQQCDLVKTCVCSHSTCNPLVGDAASSKCKNVTNSRYCGTTCTNMYFDYRGSYIRVPATAEIGSQDTQLAICAQRELDSLMRNVSRSDGVLSRVYFASVDGIWRTFPGSAQSDELCRTYDPRVRPWYREATSVKKVVVILIDIGVSMSSNLPASSGSSGTILDAAKHIVIEFLRTLSKPDFVNIVVFNSTNAIPLSPQAVLVLTVEGNNGTIGSELQFLSKELGKYTANGPNSHQSNLTAAMIAGLKNFEADKEAAKVMVVITDGKFAIGNATSLPTADLLSNGVKTFIYKLPQADDKDKDWKNQPELIAQLTAVGGHFESIEKNLENPLLAIRSFFTYTANLNRAIREDKPQYSSIYQEFDNVGGNICTVSRTAFGPKGELIGVAGITLYMDWLRDIEDEVSKALLGKSIGYPTSPQISLSAANFTIKMEDPCLGQNITVDPNEIVCPKTDEHSTIQSRTCCGSCAPPTSSTNVSKIIVPIVGVVVLGIVVGLLIWKRNHPCMKKLTGRHKSLPEQDDPIPPFQGSE